MSRKDNEFSAIRESINKLNGIPQDRDKWKIQAMEIVNKIKENTKDISPMQYYELGKYVYGTAVETALGKVFMPGSQDFNTILSLCIRRKIPEIILKDHYSNKWLPFAEKFVENKGMLLQRTVPCITLKKDNTIKIYECILIDPHMLNRDKYIYVELIDKIPSVDQYRKVVRKLLPSISERKLEEIVKKDIEALQFVAKNKEKLKQLEDIYV